MKRKIYLCLIPLVLFAAMALGQMRVDSIRQNGRTSEAYSREYAGSAKAIGGNVFAGSSILNGNISKYFHNPYHIGINVDFHRKKMVYQIDDYLGLSSTKENLTYTPDAEWKKEKAAYLFMAGGNVGYADFDNKDIKVVPLAGAGFTFLTSRLLETSPLSDHEPVLPQYKIGAYVDFKSLVLLQQRSRINDEDEYYASLRLSFGFTNNIGRPKHSNYYSGSMAYVTIGMGGLSRRFTKKEQN